MAEHPIRLYEGLFLLAQSATADLAAATEAVRNMITRHGGEILILRKWDERKLAYTIRGQKRGLYLITYFKAPSSALTAIDRDAVLSEIVLRAMVIKADHVGDIELELAKKEENLTVEIKLREEKPAAKPAIDADGIEVPDLSELEDVK